MRVGRRPGYPPGSKRPAPSPRIARRAALVVTLDLNPELDLAAAAARYAKDRIVRIPNILSAAAADAVAEVLSAASMPWRLTFSNEADPMASLYDAGRVKAAGQAVMNAELARVMRQARDGFGYIYLSYPMITAYIHGWDLGHPIHAVSEFINGPEMLDLFRIVTGVEAVNKADAQATLYRPGDFLTYHDDGREEGRVAAYTLAFTRRWRADWGGQLLFHGESGDIEQGFQPAFNTLTIFDVPRFHSVAPVAPYAGAPRLSIVGWARNDRAG